MKWIKTYQIFENIDAIINEGLTPFISLKDYDVTPEESREIFKQAEIDTNIKIEKRNKIADIQHRIRYDKLSQKDIDMLYNKAKIIGDESFVRFLRKLPPPVKRIKDDVTRQSIEEYINLDYETYKNLY